MLKKIAVAIVGFVLTSCSSIYDNGACPAINEPREVNFVLAIDNATATRASWGDTVVTDEIGSGFENRIKPESLRVSVYTMDNQLLGDIEQLQYWSIAEDNSRYQFHGTVPQALMDNMAALAAGVKPEYKFMVYANSAAGENFTIEYDYSDLNLATGAMPMWGVKVVDLSELANNRVQQLGVISLLRAAAKVEVVLDSALTDCTIDRVAINYFNRKGYLLPTGWDTATDTQLMDRDGVYRGYRSLNTLPIDFTVVDGGRKCVIYLPEYDNKMFEEFEAKLSVDVTYGSKKLSFPDALHFKTYVAGKPTGEVSNLVRNTIYRFRITNIAAGNLELDYKVADWEVGDNWDYGEFAYPTYHNPVLPFDLYNSGNTTAEITVDPTMSYNATDAEAGAFSVWFNISAPKGLHWVPTLRQSSADYQVLVYQKGVLLTDPEQWVAGSEWYNIKIVPLKPERVGNVVDFGISYTPSWMDPSSSMFLFINGHLGDIAWPNSGDDPKIIRIKQI